MRTATVDGMDRVRIAQLLRDQSGVISRRQVLEAGGDDDVIARQLRSRRWARVLRGEYVDHTGDLSLAQRHWVAVLHYWPAALAGYSALWAARVRRSSDLRETRPLVHVAVATDRRVDPVPWITVRRLTAYDTAVLHHLALPRVRTDLSLLHVAAAQRSEDAAVGVLADACQAGHTHPQRLLDVLREQTRLPRRRLLLSILDDVAVGAYSALERRYLVKVERPHGLPTAARQRRVRPGRTVAYRDVDYVGLRTVVELDGRLGHESPTDAWADLERDIAATLGGDLTVRIRWGQVLQPCRLAWAVGRILRARGWSGSPRRCGPACRPEDGSR